jgi:ubiquitin-protein ligase
MADTSRLNKPLWTNMTRLKLYEKGDKDAKFILEKNPFDDEEEEKAAAIRDEYIITGRVLPEAGIYKENGFEIEMKLKSNYPKEPPYVRILTPVYHPNIETDGNSRLYHQSIFF